MLLFVIEFSRSVEIVGTERPEAVDALLMGLFCFVRIDSDAIFLLCGADMDDAN